MHLIHSCESCPAATFGHSGALTGPVTCFSLKSSDWQNVDSCTVKLHESTAHKTESHVRMIMQCTVGPRQHTRILKLQNILSRMNTMTTESDYFWPLCSKVNGVAVNAARHVCTSRKTASLLNFYWRSQTFFTSWTPARPPVLFLLFECFMIIHKSVTKIKIHPQPAERLCSGCKCLLLLRYQFRAEKHHAIIIKLHCLHSNCCVCMCVLTCKQGSPPPPPQRAGWWCRYQDRAAGIQPGSSGPQPGSSGPKGILWLKQGRRIYVTLYIGICVFLR